MIWARRLLAAVVIAAAGVAVRLLFVRLKEE